MKQKLAALACSLLLATYWNGPVSAAEYGKPGEPVNITVGFPCCYAATWSGYVVKEKQLWKKYLPAGSTISYNIPIAGPPIVNGMLADKIQIGYLGDMPAIALATKEQIADVRLVAIVALATDQCNVLLVRKDAPSFSSPKEAVKWLEGKQIGVPRGTCADRFAREILKRESTTPGANLNQTIEVITSNFKADKIDGAVVWEPVASQAVDAGIARRAASGENFGISDSAFLVMRQDLIAARPDVAKAWLEAELDAELFMSDPANEDAVIDMVNKNVPAFSRDDLRNAIYKSYPAEQGGAAVRLVQPFVFTPEVRALLKDQTIFLHSVKGIATDTLRADAVEGNMAEALLKERGLKSPIGQVKGQ